MSNPTLLRQAKVIDLHFFGGLLVHEIPPVLLIASQEISTRTVKRDLKFGRAWLKKKIEKASGNFQ